MPKTGPSDGWRMQTAARCPIRLSPCTRPMLVVVLPSPRGVGVIAVTTTYLPCFPFAAASASRRSIPSRRTLALYGPYCSTSSSLRPSSRATSMIGRGVTERAISRLPGILTPLIEQPLGCPASRSRRHGSYGSGRGTLGLIRCGPQQVAQQQRVGERADPARDWSDCRDHVPRRLEVHVPQQLVAHHVDTHVYDHDPRREHFASDQAGSPGR